MLFHYLMTLKNLMLLRVLPDDGGKFWESLVYLSIEEVDHGSNFGITRAPESSNRAVA
jgi:hypothetical protein